MAYDSQLRKLWAEPTDGIQLHQIYSCLGYNRVDQNGNRNLGMVIERGDINKWARHKPLEYVEPIIPESKYADYRKGIDGFGRYGGLLTDSANATANNMQALFFAQGFNFLTYRRPTGSFAKRILDFDGYNHVSGFWYNLEFTSMINPYTLTYFSGMYLGGELKYTIAIGASSSDDILNGKDVVQSIGKYAGLLIVRNSKPNSWDARLQYNNKDYVIVTTEQPLFDYKKGTTTDSNGWVRVGRSDYSEGEKGSTFNLSFYIPNNNDLDSRFDFNNWLGEEIEVYPIMTKEPIFYLSTYNPATEITKFAFPDGSWYKHTFVLSNAPVGTYIAPSVITNFDIEVVGSNYRYRNVSVDLIANHTYNAVYVVSLYAITGRLYKWNSAMNSWQDVSGASIPDFSGSATLSYEGEKRTITFPTTTDIPLSSGRYKVVLHAEGEVEYKGTHPIVGAETEREFIIP